ncbi:MAG: ABC transporter permease, partial [Paracoccaceae bacterium]|nr:ABC transporter permease [Paracoccaceae bacterium]
MNLRISAKLAMRELRGGLGGFRILIICLALGVAAIAAVGSVKTGIEAGLKAEGVTLLGGDAEVEFTYRFASKNERLWFESISLKISEVADFRSMIFVQRDNVSERALTQVKAVDKNYPLSGEVVLQKGLEFSMALSEKDGVDGVVMEAVLADRLGLQVGDSLTIGTKKLRLGGILQSFPDAVGDGFNLGPRTIVYTKSLEGSGLLEPGTFFSSKYRLDLADDIDLDVIATQAQDKFVNSGLRWRDGRNGVPGIADFVDRLGAFLVIVGLSGLAVGGVGVSAAVRSYLAVKTSVIATLRSFGATSNIVFEVYFLQIAFFLLVGIALGLVLGIGGPMAFAPLIEAALPFPIRISVYAEPILQAGLYGLLMAIIFTLWPLAQVENIRATTLFRDTGDIANKLPSLRYIFLICGLVILLWGMVAFFTGYVRLTLWSGFGIGLALLALLASANLIKWISRRALPWTNGIPILRWALASISGPGEATGSVVLALGLGLSVLASVGQIDGNLRAAIQRDLLKVAPSYFFLEIQKSQMPQFRAILEADETVSRIDHAPMLRGIISKINGRPASEVAGGHWVLQGDRGVTYSELPSKVSKVVSGAWWPKDYDGPNQISFAVKEAIEMGLSLGDNLTVNIMGRDIIAKITSFREVNFSTAGIGFVMSMNPAALQSAPHSFIATVYADPSSEVRLLRALASSFPNITAIRIKDAIERISALLGSIAATTSYGASVILLTGLLVLAGISATGEPARRYEASVFRALGAAKGSILASFALRAAILGAGAGFIAIGCGFSAGYAVCRFVLETDFQVIWSNAFIIVIGGVMANLISGLFFAMRSLNAKPASVLR